MYIVYWKSKANRASPSHGPAWLSRPNVLQALGRCLTLSTPVVDIGIASGNLENKLKFALDNDDNYGIIEV